MKKHYPAIISYDNEDKRYYADFPDFKGSVFTDAENLRRDSYAQRAS